MVFYVAYPFIVICLGELSPEKIVYIHVRYHNFHWFTTQWNFQAQTHIKRVNHR